LVQKTLQCGLAETGAKGNEKSREVVAGGTQLSNLELLWLRTAASARGKLILRRGFRETRQHDLARVISLTTLEIQVLVCSCVCCIRIVAGV